jgi:ribose transport system substrate-binding protein
MQASGTSSFTRTLPTLALLLAVSVALAGCTAGSGSSSSPQISSHTVIDKFGHITSTVGPSGEKPTSATDITLSEEEVAQIKAGNHRVAILWHELSAWTQALQDGMLAEFAELGVTVTATADAKFDAATQANQIQSALATAPEVILGQAVDPTTGAAAYQPAVDAGVKLVFADQAPDGYTHGQQYQAIMTDDLYQIGTQSANAMCKAVGSTGTVAIMYYDADFHVTNFRDAVFQQSLADTCPDVRVVAKEGFSDPNKAEEIANAILVHHPDVSGIYTSWAVPAQGVLSALKGAGNTTTKIVTIDLDETMATDLVSDGGHTAAIITDEAFNYGKAMAISAAYAILGKPAPAYGVANVITVTKDNIPEGYAAWNESVPAAVVKAGK